MTGTRKRDAETTRLRILEAARDAFAASGLAGARVDLIAERAGVNKRMLYHYFGSKRALFTAVLEQAYLDIRQAEQRLDLDRLPPLEALERLVRFTWDYYLANPGFVTLVNNENLHRARHLSTLPALPDATRSLVTMTRGILDRGVAEGSIRPGIDPVQLSLTIAAIGYYYLTNRFTGSVLFQTDMMAPEALQARLDFNVDTVLRLVRA